MNSLVETSFVKHTINTELKERQRCANIHHKMGMGKPYRICALTSKLFSKCIELESKLFILYEEYHIKLSVTQSTINIYQEKN